MLQSEVDVNLDNIACTPTPAKSKEVAVGDMAGNNAAEGPNAANKDADLLNQAAADAKDKSAQEKAKDAGKDADVERKDERSQKDGDKEDGKVPKSLKLDTTQRSSVQPKKVRCEPMGLSTVPVISDPDQEGCGSARRHVR